MTKSELTEPRKSTEIAARGDEKHQKVESK